MTKAKQSPSSNDGLRTKKSDMLLDSARIIVSSTDPVKLIVAQIRYQIDRGEDVSGKCEGEIMAKEVYRYRKGKERLRGGKIIRLHDINPWEFRGYFEGEKGINFVFQYKDVKEIREVA